MNDVHLSILTSALDIKQTTRTETRVKKDKIVRYTNPDTGDTYPIQTYVDVPVQVAVPTLAGNISNLNLNRAAASWLPAA